MRNDTRLSLCRARATCKIGALSPSLEAGLGACGNLEPGRGTHEGGHPVAGPSNSLVRAYGRGTLLSALEREVLLTKIEVKSGGCLILQTQEWDQYWQPLKEPRCPEVIANLATLHSAWQSYLRSRFGPKRRREFCFQYFRLLNAVLSSRVEVASSKNWIRALRTVLGFECFAIAPEGSSPNALGAGTSTLRNPCYLLAKLKMPDALDDPQFLPLITVAGSERLELFYHYRQYTLSADSPMSLLLYPAAAKERRSASFKILNSLTGGISFAIDPRTHERARRISESLLHPMLIANKHRESGTIEVEFIDVGAGSGSLTSSLCRRIHAMGEAMGSSTIFRVWYVDLEPADPVRFFRAKKLRRLVDSLTFLGDDYREWLSRPHPLPASTGLRIGLISRLLNNLSRFDIRRVSKEELGQVPGTTFGSFDSTRHLPHVCLAPGNIGTEGLFTSNVRAVLRDGRTFLQPSLSQFYRGLFHLSATKADAEEPGEGPFLPLRTFSPESLATSDARSVVSQLLEQCDYLIIDDPDLRPEDLVDHMRVLSLASIIVQDVTKRLRLTGNHVYVLWSGAKVKRAASFSGERIW